MSSLFNVIVSKLKTQMALLIFSCEATLDNTQNVPHSLTNSPTTPLEELYASNAPRGLRMVTNQPKDGHPKMEGN